MPRGWSDDGSVIKSTCYSCRQPELDSQHPCRTVPNLLSALGDPTTSKGTAFKCTHKHMMKNKEKNLNNNTKTKPKIKPVAW